MHAFARPGYAHDNGSGCLARKEDGTDSCNHFPRRCAVCQQVQYTNSFCCSVFKSQTQLHPRVGLALPSTQRACTTPKTRSFAHCFVGARKNVILTHIRPPLCPFAASFTMVSWNIRTKYDGIDIDTNIRITKIIYICTRGSYAVANTTRQFDVPVQNAVVVVCFNCRRPGEKHRFVSGRMSGHLAGLEPFAG